MNLWVANTPTSNPWKTMLKLKLEDHGGRSNWDDEARRLHMDWADLACLVDQVAASAKSAYEKAPSSPPQARDPAPFNLHRLIHPSSSTRTRPEFSDRIIPISDSTQSRAATMFVSYPDRILASSPIRAIPTLCCFFLFLLHPQLELAHAKKPHAIAFRSPGLYPEAMAWDPTAQHFLVGSLRSRSIHAVSDAGVVEDLIHDDSLPPNSTILGVAVDRPRNRLLAVVHSVAPLPPFNALAAYDLGSRGRLFLALLPSSPSGHDRANDVAVDYAGNAYVTNSFADLIWRVSLDGAASIFSRSPAFTSFPVDRDAPHSYCGLNGIAHVSSGYLLVVQSNTGKMYKVDAEDGTARAVLLNRDLPLADDVAVRKDGVVLVVSMNKLWFLKSNDGWGEGVVYDEATLDVERFPTSVAVGAEDRAYVLYGHVLEGISGEAEGPGREWFGIEEVRSERESKEEKVWIYVVLGLGLAYFTFWRFQMKQLATNMNKKTN